MSTTVAADFFAGFFRVIGTAISAKTKSVLLDLAGMPDPADPSDDQGGEVAPQQLAYGPLGLLSNPLDPATAPDGTPWQADVFAARSGDEVIPLAWFDPRIDAAFPNGLAKGQVAFAGYGGGFHSIQLTDSESGDQKTPIHVIYAPYEFSGGTPSKAHAVILDTTPGKENVQIVHGDGYFLQMQTGKGIRMAVDGSTFAQLAPGAFSVTAANIALVGNVVLGGTAGVPLLPGLASPPSAHVFIAP